MGIRYYAYPVDAELIAVARQAPRDFMGADPLMDAWGHAEDRPRMLYLDKCWRELQDLFRGRDKGQPRPAYALVAGDVEQHGLGWVSYVKTLDPAEVAMIASDIALVDDSEVRTHFARRQSNRYGDDPAEMIEYVLSYLSAAQEFVRSLANDGKGLVYLIG